MAGEKKKMTRATRRNKKTGSKGVLSIPELRHAFDYIDLVATKNITKPASTLIKTVQKEWKKVFYRTLGKKDAMEYVARIKKSLTRRRRLSGGGCTSSAQALNGAPVNYVMRPGIADEHTYAQVPTYMAAGLNKFQYPEIAQSQDPVPQQTHYPTKVSTGGNRRLTKKRRGGACACLPGISDPLKGAFFQQVATRPIPSTAPPSMGQNLESTWAGQSTGPSSDVTSHAFKYAMSPKLS